MLPSLRMECTTAVMIGGIISIIDISHASEDSGWMEQFDLTGCEAIHAALDQIKMVVYHQE